MSTAAVHAAAATTAAAAGVRRLPLFFAYCPDRPNAFAKRLEVRPRHWARFSEDVKAGMGFFGLGLLPSSPSSPIYTSPLLKPTAETPTPPPAMDGSVMIIRAASLDDAWKRIKDDIYWTSDVWDHEKTFIREFIHHPDYVDAQ